MVAGLLTSTSPLELPGGLNPVTALNSIVGAYDDVTETNCLLRIRLEIRVQAVWPGLLSKSGAYQTSKYFRVSLVFNQLS